MPTHTGRARRASGRHAGTAAIKRTPAPRQGSEAAVRGVQRAAGNGAIARTLAPPSIMRAAATTCTTGTHSAPADPLAEVEAAELLAGIILVAASADLTMLKLDAMLPGLGAGGGNTMPTGPRMTNYQNTFGLPPAASGGRFRARIGGGTHPTRADALVAEIDALQTRFSRISDRLLGSVLRYRCIGGRTTIGTCTGHCQGRAATACFGTNLIMLCPGFWGFTVEAQALLLIHETAHLVFTIDHGRNFTHANCYATYAAGAANRTWGGTPTCVP